LMSPSKWRKATSARLGERGGSSMKINLLRLHRRKCSRAVSYRTLR
jgi:hypothetical protein